MKEITSIEEVSNTAIADAVNEDIKKLEDTMAEDGNAPMPRKIMTKGELKMREESLKDQTDTDESLADIVSRGIDNTPAPSEPIDVMEELSTEVEIEGVGTVKFPLDNCVGKSVKSAPARSERNRVFESGMNVIKTNTEKVPVVVPPSIIMICNALQKEVGTNTEFSIVCKGHWDDGKYVVNEEYQVPKQKVAGASVDYDLDHLEELKLAGYNTVIHSHPFKSSNFSSADDENINSHFECSVLYSVGEFTTAIVTVTPINGTRLVITGDPEVEGASELVPKAQIDNIKKSNSYANGSYYDYNDKWKNSHVVNDSYWEDAYYYNNLGSRNIKGGFGSSPELCEKEYDKFHNKGNYVRAGNREYDVDKDILYVNGKPVNEPGSARGRANGFVNNNPPVKVHGCSCGCGHTGGELPGRVFRTDHIDNDKANQRSGVFRADKPSQSAQRIRGNGNKKNRNR